MADPSSACCCCYQSGGDDFSHYLIELRALGTSERIYGSNVPLRRGMRSRSGRLLRECAGDHREHEAGITEDRKDAACERVTVLAKGATSNGRGRLLHATMFKGA